MGENVIYKGVAVENGISQRENLKCSLEGNKEVKHGVIFQRSKITPCLYHGQDSGLQSAKAMFLNLLKINDASKNITASLRILNKIAAIGYEELKLKS